MNPYIFIRISKYFSPKLSKFIRSILNKLRCKRHQLKALKSRLTDLEQTIEVSKDFHIEHTLLRFNIKPHRIRSDVQILIIENDDNCLSQIKRYCYEASKLAGESVVLTTTDNIYDAFALLETNIFDVVLSDLEIEYGNMYKLLGYFKLKVKAPILIISGYPSDMFNQENKENYYDDWLSKTFSPDTLKPYLQKIS